MNINAEKEILKEAYKAAKRKKKTSGGGDSGDEFELIRDLFRSDYRANKEKSTDSKIWIDDLNNSGWHFEWDKESHDLVAFEFWKILEGYNKVKREDLTWQNRNVYNNLLKLESLIMYGKLPKRDKHHDLGISFDD